MRSLAFVLLCAACVDNLDSGFPIEPGGGSVTIGDTQEGQDQTQDEDPEVLLRGRVCVVDDFFSTTCATRGADGLTVILGDQITTTNADGTFAITPAFGTGLSFLVNGADIVTTTQALTPAARIRVMRQQLFADMMTANGIIGTVGTGSIFATLVRGGLPVQGAIATSTPSPAFGPFFDGTQPAPWALDATGARGIVWFPGMVAGPADLSFNTLTGGEAIVGGVQVINGGITMVETILP
ncbi:MAG TPA: hypothetical protein VIV11_34120 [Kofleriaceae bacterium]